MRVLIVPDKFKDALDAAAVAAALAEGVRAARPGALVTCCPLGDGGEGTGRVIAQALHAQPRTTRVVDPLGRQHNATWWYEPERQLALVELAEASGLALLKPPERNPLVTTTFGTGQLLEAALHAGALSVTLCVGGSATVDGGAGCLQALGLAFLDAHGARLDGFMAGGRLTEVTEVDFPQQEAPDAIIEILCDVDNPLVGPRGAARVFAPQKGAAADAVAQLERALEHWADVLEFSFGFYERDTPGTGAAGGVPAALVAAFGAHLLRGFEEVAHHVQLREKLRQADLVLTGEGRLDEQTAGGKVVAGVARLAQEAGVPCTALVGAVHAPHGVEQLTAQLGLHEIIAITPPGTPTAAALAATAENLRRSAARAVASLA